MTDDDDVRDDVQAQLARLTQALRRARGHGNQHLSGLSMPQFLLVEPLLDSTEPAPVGALGKHAGLTRPTATAMARKLEADGLLVRSADPTDGRLVCLSLTDKGQTNVSERQKQVSAWRQRITDAVDPADRDAGARVLRALADAISLSLEERKSLG